MSRKKATKMGRPCFPAGKAKSEQIVIRVEPALYKNMVKASKRAGKPLATWIRETLAELFSEGK